MGNPPEILPETFAQSANFPRWFYGVQCKGDTEGVISLGEVGDPKSWIWDRATTVPHLAGVALSFFFDMNRQVQTGINYTRRKCSSKGERARLALADENLVMDSVPSEMACLVKSPGRVRRTAVWISRDEMVDFFESDAILEASVAMRSKISFTNEFKMAIALCMLGQLTREEDGRRSGFLVMRWLTFLSTTQVWPLRWRCARRCRSRTSSRWPSPCARYQCRGGPA